MSKPIVVICMWTAPLHVIRLNEPLYGTSMPGAGAVHHIRLCRCEHVAAGLLRLNEQSPAIRPRKSHECHDLPHALQQRCPLLDDLVGASEQLRRHIDPKRSGGLEIDK